MGVLGNSPELRIVHALVAAPTHEYTKIELARTAAVARATLDDALEHLVKWNIVIPARSAGPRITLYRLNADEPIVHAIEKFVDEATTLIAERMLKNDKAFVGREGRP